MSRKIFWDSWLLKQLGKVVKIMDLIPDKRDVIYIPSFTHPKMGITHGALGICLILEIKAAQTRTTSSRIK